ncbi:hypothetical protein ABZS93_33265 [Streptomyces sp900116325]|uniref:hypothetical protein n=1 Tax=Streptomyces sp. 900116325 TaxID=3154295 RepID=UPI0033B2179E
MNATDRSSPNALRPRSFTGGTDSRTLRRVLAVPFGVTRSPDPGWTPLRVKCV